jgi:regulatory protein
MRDISKYNVTLALKEIPDSDYYTTFQELVEKRLRQLENETNLQKKRKKLADYLLYRGWESHLVWNKISEII